MLGQRRRRWTNIDLTVCGWLVFAAWPPCEPNITTPTLGQRRSRRPNLDRPFFSFWEGWGLHDGGLTARRTCGGDTIAARFYSLTQKERYFK